MPSLYPLDTRRVAIERVREMGIDAALVKQLQKRVIDSNGCHAVEPVGCERLRQPHVAERWIIVADAGSVHAIHAEAVGPECGWCHGPVILQTAVLHVRQVDIAIPIVPNNRGCCGLVVVAAVASIDLVLGRELMIHLSVELPAWIGRNDDLAPVRIWKGRARYVRLRIKIQNRLPDWVDVSGRNFVSRKLVTSAA